MEMEGINLDADFLKSMATDMQKEIANFEQKIYETAGEKFNLASPKQLGDILFDKLKFIITINFSNFLKFFFIAISLNCEL